MILQGPSRGLLVNIGRKERKFQLTYLGQKNIGVWQNEMTVRKRGMTRLAKDRKCIRSFQFAFPTFLNTTRHISPKISFTKDYPRKLNICGMYWRFMAPLITFPLAVFLKNLRWVMTASDFGLLRTFISTMTEGNQLLT